MVWRILSDATTARLTWRHYRVSSSWRVVRGGEVLPDEQVTRPTSCEVTLAYSAVSECGSGPGLVQVVAGEVEQGEGDEGDGVLAAAHRACGRLWPSWGEGVKVGVAIGAAGPTSVRDGPGATSRASIRPATSGSESDTSRPAGRG